MRIPKETKRKHKLRLTEFKVFVREWQTRDYVQKRELNVDIGRCKYLLPNTSIFFLGGGGAGPYGHDGPGLKMYPIDH